MKQLFTLLLAAMAFVACTQNEVEELSANREALPETLTVGFEGDDTRVELNEALKTVWTEGDEVSVFYRSYENTRWAFQGETGDRSGDLTLVSGNVGDNTMDNTIVVYPYSDSYAIDADTHAVEASLPAVQSYKDGSYGAEGNIMVAAGEFTQFSLKSVVGWLRVELTGEGEVVESIKVRGNDGEQVAGLCYINAADASIALAGSEVEESLVATEVVLNCGEGVELGAEATEFYIALLPQTFEKGLTVEINYANGNSQTLVCENNVTIRRNHISPINIEADEETDIPTNKLWYTATALVEPYDATAFNVAIVSNEWDETTGEGVITFDGELTMIGMNAFSWCESLTSVTIGNSVTWIGQWAFYDCTSLTSVTIPDSVTWIGSSAFEGCSSLTSVTIPDSVTTIGEYAFYNCSSLTSVIIGDSVKTIRDGVFSGCSSLTSVTIPNSVTSIGNSALSGCTSLTSVTIPDSVTSIGNSALAGCSSLAEFKGKFAADGGRCLIIDGVLNAFALGCGVTEYTIPDSVTTIGDSAFSRCTSLTSVTIPDSVTTIGNWAFYDCDSLTSVYITDVAAWCNIYFEGSFSNPLYYAKALYINNELVTDLTIPDSVTTIGGQAFENCTSLTSVTIPDSVTTIGDSAFSRCTSLTSVTIPDSVTTIEGWAFADCHSLKSVTIPDSVTTIGEYAFRYCTSLTSVTIPDSVTTIGKAAFGGCSNLAEFKGKFAADGGRCLIKDNTIIAYAEASGTTYTIPDSVTTIGDSAFSSCRSLTSVTIPDSVTTIGEDAFYLCGSLTSVYCEATTPPTLGGSYVFDYNKSGRKIYVPAESVEAYKSAANWSDYAADIVGYNFETGEVVE